MSPVKKQPQNPSLKISMKLLRNPKKSQVLTTSISQFKLVDHQDIAKLITLYPMPFDVDAEILKGIT